MSQPSPEDRPWQVAGVAIWVVCGLVNAVATGAARAEPASPPTPEPVPPLAVGASGVEPPPGLEPAEFEAAIVDFRNARYADCLDRFARVSRASTGRAGLSARAAYGAACCAAAAGRIDRAFEELGLAVSNGFDDPDRALADARLAALARDARWLPFLRKAQGVREIHEREAEPNLLAWYTEVVEGRRANADEAAQAARRAEVVAIVDAGRLRRASDYLHAAALLVDSDRPAEIGRAVALARRGLELDPDRLELRPVYAQALDRQLLLAGRPQKFGTQSIRDGESFRLWDVDPAVTDADRALWGVSPLAELASRAARRAAP